MLSVLMQANFGPVTEVITEICNRVIRKPDDIYTLIRTYFVGRAEHEPATPRANSMHQSSFQLSDPRSDPRGHTLFVGIPCRD